ncbi:unnamed protein product, partial [Urochloa humidicola]
PSHPSSWPPPQLSARRDRGRDPRARGARDGDAPALLPDPNPMQPRSPLNLSLPHPHLDRSLHSRSRRHAAPGMRFSARASAGMRSSARPRPGQDLACAAHVKVRTLALAVSGWEPPLARPSDGPTMSLRQHGAATIATASRIPPTCIAMAPHQDEEAPLHIWAGVHGDWTQTEHLGFLLPWLLSTAAFSRVAAASDAAIFVQSG